VRFYTLKWLKPNSTGALSGLAWILATHPSEQFRNGPRALQLAQEAMNLGGEKDPAFGRLSTPPTRPMDDLSTQLRPPRKRATWLYPWGMPPPHKPPRPGLQLTEIVNSNKTDKNRFSTSCSDSISISFMPSAPLLLEDSAGLQKLTQMFTRASKVDRSAANPNASTFVPEFVGAPDHQYLRSEFRVPS
jgi:hypothetical protein